MTNNPCTCFKILYIVKSVSHKIMHRFNEISINIQDSFFFSVVFDKPTKYISIYMYYIYKQIYIEREM